MTEDRFDLAKQTLEGRVAAARNTLKMEEDRYKKWRLEMTWAERVNELLRSSSTLEAACKKGDDMLKEATAGVETYRVGFEKARHVYNSLSSALGTMKEMEVDLSNQRAPAPRPVAAQVEAEPVKTEDLPDFVKREVRPTVDAPFRTQANGFDRYAAIAQFRQWRVHYPLAKSYKTPGGIERQALTAVLTDHPRYAIDWLDNGGLDLLTPGGGNMDVLHSAAQVLGVDVALIRATARHLHSKVSAYGTPGVDYMWNDA